MGSDPRIILLDLLVPCLIPPVDAPPQMRDLRLPALEKWLARAPIGRARARSDVEWLADAFSLASPAPVAPIALAGEGMPRDGLWLRADPVHLRIERDAAALHHGAALGIDREEADALAAALQAHFAIDGLELLVQAPDRWYARVPEGTLPVTTPLDEALGRNVHGLLPAAGGKINWRSAFTEAQMILAGHDVNARREASGRPAINSVWFWGGGALPAQVAAPYKSVYARDPFARGLATLSRARVFVAPERLSEIAPATVERSLAVIDVLSEAFHRGDPERWSVEARRLEASWFEPLGPAIARFGEVRLILPARKDTLVATLTSASRLRWFRPRKPLTAHA